MAVPPLPTSAAGQAAYIGQERQKVIQPLYQQARKQGKVPDPEQEPVKSLLPRLDALLDRLETDIQMTGEMKQQTKIDQALELIFSPTKCFYFSNEHMERARKLSEKWEDLAITAPPVRPVAVEIDEDEDRQSKRRKPSTADRDAGYIKFPPPDHPIWGRTGIMHGLALKKTGNGRKSTVLNPEYEDEKIDCRRFGHNGLKVGTWFPTRLSALFHGAHGHSQAGIHGNPSDGAYSIVVSGQYDLLDTDRGNMLLYSGSGSHKNTNPDRPADATDGTKALDKSLETGKPVRVLRTSEGRSVYHPIEGVRYDGLYQVIDKHYPKNSNRGIYEQFELHRLADDEEQCSLEACKRRPTPGEIRDFNRREDGYPSRR